MVNLKVKGKEIVPLVSSMKVRCKPHVTGLNMYDTRGISEEGQVWDVVFVANHRFEDGGLVLCAWLDTHEGLREIAFTMLEVVEKTALAIE